MRTNEINYAELLDWAYENGMNNAELALRRMMDIVERENGYFPNWSDQVPDWILKNFGYK